MSDLWAELTNRQQGYLRACFQVDQDTERREHTLQRRGQRARPEAAWRWMLYGPTLPASPLLYALRDHKLADGQTTMTFAELEKHGLIHCRYTQHSVTSVLLYVQMTPKGRVVFRAARAYYPHVVVAGRHTRTPKILTPTAAAQCSGGGGFATVISDRTRTIP